MKFLKLLDKKDVQINIKNNTLNNDFFKYHKAKMKEAKVFLS